MTSASISSAVAGRRGRGGSLEDGEDQSRLRGDNPAEKTNGYTKYQELNHNALSTYLKGKSPGCWGAGGSEREEEDVDDDEGDLREEEGWSWWQGQPMSLVMSSAAGASHAGGKNSSGQRGRHVCSPRRPPGK